MSLKSKLRCGCTTTVTCFGCKSWVSIGWVIRAGSSVPGPTCRVPVAAIIQPGLFPAPTIALPGHHMVHARRNHLVATGAQIRFFAGNRPHGPFATARMFHAQPALRPAQIQRHMPSMVRPARRPPRRRHTQNLHPLPFLRGAIAKRRDKRLNLCSNWVILLVQRTKFCFYFLFMSPGYWSGSHAVSGPLQSEVKACAQLAHIFDWRPYATY